MTLRGLSGSVPADSTFACYHKAPGSEREYATVIQHNCFHILDFTFVQYLPLSFSISQLILTLLSHTGEEALST